MRSAFSPNYLNKLLNLFTQKKTEKKTLNSPSISMYKSSRYNKSEGESLSQREIDVLHHLAAGLSNQAIAQELIVAPSTIKSPLKSIYRKLNVENRIEAVTHARHQNFV